MRIRTACGVVLAGGWLAASCGDDPIAPTPDASVDGSIDAGPDGDGGPIAAPYGLDSRPSNPTCLAPKRPPGTAAVKFERVFSNVGIGTTLHIAQIPGDSTRMFALNRGGTMESFSTVNPPNVPTVVMQIPNVNFNGEGGLLGFAFHPKFAQNGYLYVSYTTYGGSTDMRSVVCRLTSPDNGATFPMSSYVEIIPPFEQPFVNHDGGDLHFGKDGYLYASFGDGGSGGDPLGNGQKLTSYFSKILRIDVDNPSGGKQFGIPSDNPFANSSTAEPATFAYGFRNPFRFSIDPETNQLWVGDVGEELYEEVDKIASGGNYGWNFREGRHCFKPATNCPTAGLIDPVWEHARDQTLAAVVGGPVYRGKTIPSLVGKVIVGDYPSNRVWYLTDQGDGTWKETEIVDRGGGGIWAAFDTDNDGEVYGVSIPGLLYKLVPAAPEPPSTFPDTLSKTGCVDPTDPKKAAAGLIPFAPVSPLWSDGAEKERFLAIPDGTKITVGSDGDFEFPVGTVLMKHFRLGGKLVETRLFMRHDDGGWEGYSYEWNDAETDARLLPANKTRKVGNATWYYPSRGDCTRCHTAAAGGSLGPETLQLNSDVVYAATNRVSNQLRTLEHIGMLDKPLPAPADQLPALVAPDGSAPLDARARSYLHANCSFCHRPTGGGGGTIDLRYATPFASMNACNATPQTGDLGIPLAKVIAPGSPATSILVQRPKHTDVLRMPPLGTLVVDPVGVGILEQWVQGMGPCPAVADAGAD